MSLVLTQFSSWIYGFDSRLLVLSLVALVFACINVHRFRKQANNENDKYSKTAVVSQLLQQVSLLLAFLLKYSVNFLTGELKSEIQIRYVRLYQFYQIFTELSIFVLYFEVCQFCLYIQKTEKFEETRLGCCSRFNFKKSHSIALHIISHFWLVIEFVLQVALIAVGPWTSWNEKLYDNIQIAVHFFRWLQLITLVVLLVCVGVSTKRCKSLQNPTLYAIGVLLCVQIACYMEWIVVCIFRFYFCMDISEIVYITKHKATNDAATIATMIFIINQGVAVAKQILTRKHCNIDQTYQKVEVPTYI